MLDAIRPLFVWALPILAYMLGSMPCGVLIARRFTPVDIRRQGSGNIGATNVMRLAGVLPGLLTLAADGLKGFLPTALAHAIAPAAGSAAALYISAAGLAAVCGHLFPLFSRFRGGKGVATTAGVFLVIAPAAVLVAAVGFALAAALSRRASVGSLVAALLLIPATAWAADRPVYTFSAAAATVLIFLCHRSNIARLIRGTEPPFRSGKLDR